MYVLFCPIWPFSHCVYLYKHSDLRHGNIVGSATSHRTPKLVSFPLKSFEELTAHALRWTSSPCEEAHGVSQHPEKPAIQQLPPILPFPQRPLPESTFRCQQICSQSSSRHCRSPHLFTYRDPWNSFYFRLRPYERTKCQSPF